MTIKHKAYNFIQSMRFFYATLVLLAFQAIWIAVSGLYPMAFDENTHLGIIRLYAGRLLPFWSSEPAGESLYGAVSRDPSYMYNYIMSFPYRVFAHFFHSEYAQVMFLRFINVILFLVGFMVFRLVLLNAGVSKRIMHSVLAIFVLIPVVPFLAGQLNYDNLLFLVIGITLLLCQRLARHIKATGSFDLYSFLLILVVCLFGSLVKYAFLPIFFAIALYCLWLWVREAKRQGTHKAVWLTSWQIFKRIGAWQKTIVLVLAVVLSGLWLERYAVNTVRYHTPIPECNQVLSIERCMAYSPWRRNYLTRQDKLQGKLPQESTNPISYTVRYWIPKMMNGMFRAIDGVASNYIAKPPYVLLEVLPGVTLGIGIALFLRWQRELRHRYRLNMLLLLSAVYLALLWTQNYMDFLNIGYPFAIQGRYLIPILPVLCLVAVLGFNRLLRSKPNIKSAMVYGALLVLLTQGGGIGVFILRSDNSWYWPKPAVQHLNNGARRVLSPVVFGD